MGRLDETSEGLLIVTNDSARLRMIFIDRGLRAPITIGTINGDVNVRVCDGEPFERRGWQHQL